VKDTDRLRRILEKIHRKWEHLKKNPKDRDARKAVKKLAARFFQVDWFDAACDFAKEYRRTADENTFTRDSTRARLRAQREKFYADNAELLTQARQDVHELRAWLEERQKQKPSEKLSGGYPGVVKQWEEEILKRAVEKAFGVNRKSKKKA